MASPGHLEIEKLTELGKSIGLTGQELLDFVKEERAVLKEQRDAERAARAEEREAKEREAEKERELASVKLRSVSVKLRSASVRKSVKLENRRLRKIVCMLKKCWK